ncbi:MAG: YjbQ family protein [Myxococcales bacterium]|nr:YjbQ family protein [Myxococcales bacterium]
MAATEVIDVRTTTRSETVDITALVRAAVRRSGVDDGIAVVFCKHTTAGLTIQENSDPQVRAAVLAHLTHAVPHGAGAVSAATNADAHVKSSLIGVSLALVVEAGKPVIGPWQAIYFCEFDGPRNRHVLVKVVGQRG